MKRHFPTVIDQQAKDIDTIYVSGGERGTQIKLNTTDLIGVTNAQVIQVIHE